MAMLCRQAGADRRQGGAAVAPCCMRCLLGPHLAAARSDAFFEVDAVAAAPPSPCLGTAAPWASALMSAKASVHPARVPIRLPPAPPARSVLTFCPTEGLPALQVVGRVLYDQAVAFYVADAQASMRDAGLDCRGPQAVPQDWWNTHNGKGKPRTFCLACELGARAPAHTRAAATCFGVLRVHMAG